MPAPTCAAGRASVEVCKSSHLTPPTSHGQMEAQRGARTSPEKGSCTPTPTPAGGGQLSTDRWRGPEGRLSVKGRGLPWTPPRGQRPAKRGQSEVVQALAGVTMVTGYKWRRRLLLSWVPGQSVRWSICRVQPQPPPSTGASGAGWPGAPTPASSPRGGQGRRETDRDRGAGETGETETGDGERRGGGGRATTEGRPQGRGGQAEAARGPRPGRSAAPRVGQAGATAAPLCRRRAPARPLRREMRSRRPAPGPPAAGCQDALSRPAPWPPRPPFPGAPAASGCPARPAAPVVQTGRGRVQRVPLFGVRPGWGSPPRLLSSWGIPANHQLS